MKIEKVFYAFGNKIKSFNSICTSARKMPKQSEAAIYNIVLDNGNVVGDYTIINNYKKGSAAKNNPVQNVVETIKKGIKYKNTYYFDDGTRTQILYTPNAYRVRKFENGRWKLVRYDANNLHYATGDSYRVVNSVEPTTYKIGKHLAFENAKDFENLRLLTKKEQAQILEAAKGETGGVYKFD